MSLIKKFVVLISVIPAILFATDQVWYQLTLPSDAGESVFSSYVIGYTTLTSQSSAFDADGNYVGFADSDYDVVDGAAFTSGMTSYGGAFQVDSLQSMSGYNFFVELYGVNDDVLAISGLYSASVLSAFAANPGALPSAIWTPQLNAVPEPCSGLLLLVGGALLGLRRKRHGGAAA